MRTLFSRIAASAACLFGRHPMTPWSGWASSSRPWESRRRERSCRACDYHEAEVEGRSFAARIGS